ncbi:hypothetical protein [Nannocystis bainbridge]|uniref:Secreted protein n=1 Tax=Nannocystis bainbridge TaxID=2995303 RepID=A0ABT5EAG0_9BACT|nr:hypothetical protein [Nannocystis bainbridge]MDC0722847.1 hypothetical protein [Nannocystis bainbridge]
MLLSALLTVLAGPADEVAAEPEAAAEPGEALSEAPNATRTWECVVGDEDGAVSTFGEGEVQIYCLAYCEGFEEYRRAWRYPVDPVDKPSGWCRSKANRYCHRYNLDYGDSCYGENY